jgi:TP901 family phage tail tape measure protein
MPSVGEILVRLGVNNAAFTAGLAESEAQLKGFGKSAGASGSQASSGFNAAGMAMGAVAVGAVAFGTIATKQASTFASSMELIKTQAGGTEAEVKAMSAGILALAPQVGMGPEALAAGLYHLESAGMRGAKALDMLKIAAEGAKVGHADLESVTNALIAATNSGVGGVANMTGAMGTLNAIVGAGNMRMADLTGAMGTGILSTAKSFGVSLQSVGAALADMTNQGIPAQEAATRLRMTMSLLGAPSKKAAKELASIGLSSTALAKDMRGPGGMLAAVQDLRKHLDSSGLSATKQAQLLSAAFGGGKSSSGILTLVGNVDKLQAAQDAVTKGAGSFGDAWATTSASVAVQGEQVGASMDTITTAIGSGLLPAVGNALHAIVPIISGMAQWAAANPDTAATILAVVAGAAALGAAVAFLGPILGGIAAVIGLIASPLTLVVGGIVALAAHFGLLGKGAKDTFDGLVATVQGAIPGIIAKLQDLAAQFVAWIGPMIPVALKMLGDFAASVIAWIGQQVPGWLATLSQWAKAFVDWVTPMVPVALKALGDFAASVIGWIAAQLPVWGAQLLTWADAFIGWVGPMVPVLLKALGDFGASLIQWILDEIPVAVGALAQLALEFVSWVIGKIPDLLTALAQLGVALIGWIVGEIPVLVGALLKWGGELIGWIADSLPKALGAFGRWIGGVFAWMGRQELIILTKAAIWGAKILAGVIGAVKSLPTKIGEVWTNIQTAATMAWNTITSAIGVVLTGIVTNVRTEFASIVSAITGMPGRVASAASGMWDGIWDAFRGVINSIIRGWNSLQFSLPRIDMGPLGVVGGFTIGTPNLPYLHAGGVVPGRQGEDVLAVLRAGERVTPAGSPGSAGNTISLVVNNPRPEPASTSISRELLKLSALGYVS